jgi:cyclohexanone monooxygenase
MEPVDMPETKAPSTADVVIVGAGFAGMYMLHRLRKLGMSARVFEAASGVGGTWYWNRYPGARCDVESMQYSYSFSPELQQEWQWSELFASQPEILRYANHVADRLDLRRDIQFDTRVISARFNRTTHRWMIRTDRGDEVSAQYCVMATGCLSTARVPDFKGLEDFTGKTYHTGHWPHEGVDLTGQRVGVIGTGSSAIQAIPVIAKQAEQLYVFQRTPNFSIPSRNGAMTPDYEMSWKRSYVEKREKARQARTGILNNPNDQSALEITADERQRQYEERWAAGGTSFMAAFNDLIFNQQANDTAAEFVRDKIRATVRDQTVAELLAPKNHPIGTKRICVDTEYYDTYNRPNVTLVDARSTPITEITPHGLRTTDREYQLDSIVFATGFDAMTGAVLKVEIDGGAGQTLRQKWEAGPCTYLGLMTAGFPNLFMITGPGSPSVLSNMMVSIEQHVDWIAGCLDYLRSRGLDCIEATQSAEDAWVAHGNEVANNTLYPLANSWYMGVNIPGKPQVFMPYIGGVGVYRQTCADIAASGYQGFELTSTARTAAAAE